MRFVAQSISAVSSTFCRNLKGIFFDIDDTFSLDGRIPETAYSALWRAVQAGLVMVPITGRPAGWADHIARMWPVVGVVGENGAFYFAYDEPSGRLIKRFHEEDPYRRSENMNRLERIFKEAKALFPTVELASDQPYRETDLAVDFREDVAVKLDFQKADEIRRLFEERGATAKVSSIHVNAWFGDYDKLSMCAVFVKERLGMDLEVERDNFLFCGDSPNDVPMFAYFPVSAGVAGVERFNEAGLMEAFPSFVSGLDGGHGFEEIVDTVLSKRV